MVSVLEEVVTASVPYFGGDCHRYRDQGLKFETLCERKYLINIRTYEDLEICF